MNISRERIWCALTSHNWANQGKGSQLTETVECRRCGKQKEIIDPDEW